MNKEELKNNILSFFKNSNTLTFFLVIVLVVVIYFIYNYMVNRAIRPVSIPYANELITAKTQITSDMIGNIQISGSFVTTSGHNLMQNRGLILDKYVKEGYQIQANSFFYQEALVDETENDKGQAYDIPDGYTLYYLSTSFHETYGCSIMPGNYIDLYVKMRNPYTGNLFFKNFIKSIQVTRIVDSSYVDVFAGGESGSGKCNPSYLQFVIPEEFQNLLELAKMSSEDIKFVPVPRNAGYTENPEETRIVNEEVEEYIKSLSVQLS